MSIGFLLISISVLWVSGDDRISFGVDYVKEELRIALSRTAEKRILADPLIKDNETAVIISEAILFKISDEENITTQRHYEVNFIDNYWILNGTLPRGMDGGTFLIILNATNEEIIRLTHTKRHERFPRLHFLI